ncbi:MAG TPA: ribosome-associated translation inhibitor RaiA [Mycobacteriales bacterium]|jgi:ribosomal subunit interface protein|nr:ribosome-associated translation inhibitor RaiA [Mycobacteriales bacterium]
MDVVVKSRRAVVGQRFKANAQDKLDRLAKLDEKANRVDVEVCEERNPRQSASRVRVELTCHTRGPLLCAKGAATDALAAFDVAVEKLEHQLRKAADRRRVHHGSRAPRTITSEISPEVSG